MREIKFRAWDEDGHMIYPPFLVSFFASGKPILMEPTGTFGTHGSAIELMQYTGLKDRNGTEIYEGDIVLDCTNRIPKTMKVVTYNATCAEFYPFGQHDSSWFSEQVEVIGNIYENPELLTEKE